MKIHWFFKVLGILTSLFLIWVIFYYGLPELLPTQRVESGQVYGLILSDQIWGGDIKIVGDVYSPTNSKVTVLPGTKIRVSIKGDKSNFDFLPWHWKSGVNTGLPTRGVNTGEPFWDETEKIQIHLNNVEMVGEPSNPIVITSDSEKPSPYDFNVLSINSGQILRAHFSNYRRFQTGANTTIKNSSFKDTGECSICLNKGAALIDNNIFENSLRESIWVSKASPEITNNLFINLAGQGIKIDSKRLSAPQITNNVFEMPQQTAIDIISGGQIQDMLIARNVFSGSSLLKIACDAKVKIRDNVILGLISFSSGCDGGFEFGPNYWGTPDIRSIISEKILNKYDNYPINIPTVLLLPPKEAGRK